MSFQSRTAKRIDVHIQLTFFFVDFLKYLQGSSSEDKDLFSYTIITVDSSAPLKWLHDRMPVSQQSHSFSDLNSWKLMKIN